MAAAPKIAPNELETEIVSKMSAVPELAFLKAEAEKLGVEAHLFGGTAASFAHYVKDDLERRKGSGGYQADRFDYDFASIFRSTQDLDVVVDGPRDKIEQLARIVKERYPHFIGDKANKWEMRSLRESYGRPGQPGYKEALLDSPDFLLQNSDSHSTGLIRVTRGDGSTVIRDLRDWNSEIPQFERDVLQNRLHYYASDRHYESPRARNGGNPEIFSVIRALTKAFQYDLKFTTDTTQAFETIIGRTQWNQIRQSRELHRRLVDISKKLFLHAVDVERAWNTCEELGLRKTLSAFDSAGTVDSLAWLMSKEPLRAKPVGEGTGRTAADIARTLGVTEIVVSHETHSFLAYESITRSRAGVPNFYVSRQNAPGEAAIHGWGVYSKLGRKGAVGTQITIRMKLHPDAREGTDFVYLAKENFFLIRNKNAAQVINEPIRLSTVGFLTMIATAQENFEGDLALLETFRRKLARNPEPLTAADKRTIRRLLKTTAGDKKASLVYELEKIGLREFMTTEDVVDGIRRDPRRGGIDKLSLEIALARIKSEPKAKQRALIERAIVRIDAKELWLWATVVEAASKAGLSDAFTKNEHDLVKIGATHSTYDGGFYDISLAKSSPIAAANLPIAPTMGMFLQLLRFHDWQKAEQDSKNPVLVKSIERFFELNPALEDVESLKSKLSGSVRAEFLKARLQRAKTADEFLHVFEGEARTYKHYDEDGRSYAAKFDSGYFHEKTGVLWSAKAVDHFFSLHPTRQQMVESFKSIRDLELQTKVLSRTMKSLSTARELVEFTTDTFRYTYGAKSMVPAFVEVWKTEAARFLSLEPSATDLEEVKVRAPIEISVVVIQEMAKRAKTASQLMEALELQPEKLYPRERFLKIDSNVGRLLVQTWESQMHRLPHLGLTDEHLERIEKIGKFVIGFPSQKINDVVLASRVGVKDYFSSIAEGKFDLDKQRHLAETFKANFGDGAKALSAADANALRATIENAPAGKRTAVVQQARVLGLGELVSARSAVLAVPPAFDESGYRADREEPLVKFALERIASEPKAKRKVLLDELIVTREVLELNQWSRLVKEIDEAKLGDLLDRNDRELAEIGEKYDRSYGEFNGPAGLRERALVSGLPKARTVQLAIQMLKMAQGLAAPPDRKLWMTKSAKRIADLVPTEVQVEGLKSALWYDKEFRDVILDELLKRAKTTAQFIHVLRTERKYTDGYESSRSAWGEFGAQSQGLWKRHFARLEALTPTHYEWETISELVTEPTIEAEIAEKRMASARTAEEMLDTTSEGLRRRSHGDNKALAYSRAWSKQAARFLSLSPTDHQYSRVMTRFPKEIAVIVMDERVRRAKTAGEVLAAVDLKVDELTGRNRLDWHSPLRTFVIEQWDKHIGRFAELLPTDAEAYRIKLSAIYVPGLDADRLMKVIEAERARAKAATKMAKVSRKGETSAKGSAKPPSSCKAVFF